MALSCRTALIVAAAPIMDDAGVAEHLAGGAAHRQDGGDADARDPRRQEAVLDGRGSGLLPAAVVAGDHRTPAYQLQLRGDGAGASDALAGVLERLLDHAAEEHHDGHDQRRDAGDQQAVLHGRGAALVVSLRRVASEHNADEVDHVLSSRWMGRPTGDCAAALAPPCPQVSGAGARRTSGCRAHRGSPLEPSLGLDRRVPTRKRPRSARTPQVTGARADDRIPLRGRGRRERRQDHPEWRLSAPAAAPTRAGRCASP